jgi:hypothetical protein
MQTRYEPTTINDLQKCLDGCSDKMRVEVKAWPWLLHVALSFFRDRIG